MGDLLTDCLAQLLAVNYPVDVDVAGGYRLVLVIDCRVQKFNVLTDLLQSGVKDKAARLAKLEMKPCENETDTWYNYSTGLLLENYGQHIPPLVHCHC